MFTKQGVRRFTKLRDAVLELVDKLDQTADDFTEINIFYQLVLAEINTIIEKNQATDTIAVLNPLGRLCQLIPSTAMNANLEEKNPKYKKLILLANHHLSHFSFYDDLHQPQGRGQDYGQLIEERNPEALSLLELMRLLGKYTSWLAHQPLTTNLKLITNSIADNTLPAIRNLKALTLYIEIAAYTRPDKLDQTRVATLVTSVNTILNEIVKLNPSLVGVITDTRKLLADMSRLFEAHELRRDSREKVDALNNKLEQSHAQNAVLINLLLDAESPAETVIDSSNNQLLGAAAVMGNQQLTARILNLLDPNADEYEVSQSFVEHVNLDDYTPVELAMLNGHIAVAQILKARGAEINRINHSNLSFLQHVARIGNKTAVKTAVALGADIDYLGVSNLTAFELAVLDNHPSVATYLLEKGAEIHRVDGNNQTFLHGLAAAGEDVATELLLSLAKNEGTEILRDLINAENEWGQTALDIALNNGHYLVAKALLKFGANLNHCDRNGKEAIHRAAEEADLFKLEFILGHGVKTDQRTTPADLKNSCTPLHCAFAVLTDANKLQSVARFLIDQGADWNARINDVHAARDVLMNRLPNARNPSSDPEFKLTNSPEAVVTNQVAKVIEYINQYIKTVGERKALVNSFWVQTWLPIFSPATHDKIVHKKPYLLNPSWKDKSQFKTVTPEPAVMNNSRPNSSQGSTLTTGTSDQASARNSTRPPIEVISDLQLPDEVPSSSVATPVINVESGTASNKAVSTADPIAPTSPRSTNRLLITSPNPAHDPSRRNTFQEAIMERRTGLEESDNSNDEDNGFSSDSDNENNHRRFDL